MSVKVAQTFYIDRSVVKGSVTVTLDSIDLYFKSKPRSTKNMSGITEPGVTLYICEVDSNGVPTLSKKVSTATARVEYNSIIASSDASIKTKFKFKLPVVVETNKNYGLTVAFDGGEEFKLWTCTQGERLVGTNTVTGGATSKNVGKYFEFTNSGTLKALNHTDLKFSVYASTYSANTSANTVTTTYLLPSGGTEYVMYNRYHPTTAKYGKGVIGEMVFQETPVILGTITVNASNTSIKANSPSINFSTLFPSTIHTSSPTLSSNPIPVQKQYIVLRNGSTQSANVDVVEVISVVSNTEISLERVPTFSSNTATFSITAAGKLDHKEVYYYTGRWFDYTTNTMKMYKGKKTDIIRLEDSNANSSVRFVNNMVQSITVVAGGTGYSNSDVVTVYPVVNSNTADPTHLSYIPSYANAVANVVTNGTGAITGITVTNAGYGLCSNVILSITTSAGVSANLVPEIGSVLRGVQSNTYYADCVVTNSPIHRSYPNITLLSSQNHVTKVIQHFAYYTNPNYEHILVQPSVAYNKEVSLKTNNPMIDLDYNDGRVYCLASRSNEMSMANVTVALANGTNFTTQVKSSSILEVPVTSNNAFTMPVVQEGSVYNYSYVVNNDLDGETKGNGSALCRHISEKVTFAENRNAEDIMVYCDVYKPAGTDVHVYARLHNKLDPDAFDDKDWTLLELKSNNGSITSSLTNENDLIELTYGLPTCPSSVNTISGDCTTTISSANLVGVGTTWSTDLKVNDVIKVYSNLFPTNYMVSVVRSVSNNTLITLDDAVTDTNIVGNMKVDLIGRPNDGTNDEIGTPFQAFTYKPNNYICRYYTASMSKMDTYNTFSVKIVLTSNNDAIVPKVWNTRAVGVSA